MKITLIMPRNSNYPQVKKTVNVLPLTLTTLASLVPPELGAEITIIDELNGEVPDRVQGDLVGISALTGSVTRAYAIADKIREQGTPVVLGGIHPTLMPEEAIQHADCVVRGLAEGSWPELLNDFKNNRMKKIYCQSPDISLGKRREGSRLVGRGKVRSRVNAIQATCGCLNACDFCVIPKVWGRKMYFTPIQEVIAELEKIESKKIIFVDVSPVENIEYAKALYRAMIPLKKQWVSPATTKIADDPELLELAVKSGCRGLFIGFESISQSTLLSTNKAFNHAGKYKALVRKLHDHGIMIQGGFVFGFDADDASVFERTVEVIQELKIDLPRFTVYTPFPGTPVFETLEKEKRIIQRDWRFYDSQHVVFKPARMTAEELQLGLLWAWKQSYKLSGIFQRLRWEHLLSPGAVAMNLLFRKYAKELPENVRAMNYGLGVFSLLT